MTFPLSIHGFGYVATREQVRASEPEKLDLGLLERSLRRGLSDVTRLFMHAAKLALEDAGSEPGELQVIFASAFGEIATAEALLMEAYDQNGSSPARFRHSVHNTAAGLFSISTKNHLPCTAVAAGWDTTAMALIEARAQLALESERVLLVFAEESVPRAFSDEHDHGRLAAAFVLGRGATARHGALTNMRRAPVEPHDGSFVHPLAPALDLAHAIERRMPRTLRLSEGREPWTIDFEPPALHERASGVRAAP